MTQDDIIRMAREADVPFETETDGSLYGMIGRMCNEDFFKFAALVAAHEREACAKVADGELMNTNMLTSYPPKSSAAWNIAAAIRARGNNK